VVTWGKSWQGAEVVGGDRAYGYKCTLYAVMWKTARTRTKEMPQSGEVGVPTESVERGLRRIAAIRFAMFARSCEGLQIAAVRK
jgi:hypothetical protein